MPHKEHDDHVEAELTYAGDLYELNRRVNSSESIVGELKINFNFMGLAELHAKDEEEFLYMCHLTEIGSHIYA